MWGDQSVRQGGDCGWHAGRSVAEAFGLDGAQKDAEKLKDTLSTPNKLNLDKNEIEEALTLVERLSGMLRSISGLSQSARDSVDSSADREMRRAYSDFGVVP